MIELVVTSLWMLFKLLAFIVAHLMGSCLDGGAGPGLVAMSPARRIHKSRWTLLFWMLN
jgi:tRNA1(Val) A37 N6-methylase TrmN6